MAACVREQAGDHRYEYLHFINAILMPERPIV